MKAIADYYRKGRDHYVQYERILAGHLLFLPDIMHLTCLPESDIRNVLRMTGNVGPGDAESNIARHEQDVSNVERRWGMLMFCHPPKYSQF